MSGVGDERTTGRRRRMRNEAMHKTVTNPELLDLSEKCHFGTDDVMGELDALGPPLAPFLSPRGRWQLQQPLNV
jgi:hypothetical protein